MIALVVNIDFVLTFEKRWRRIHLFSIVTRKLSNYLTSSLGTPALLTLGDLVFCFWP